MAPERDAWLRKNVTFYSDDRAYMQFLVPSGMRVLDIGCGTGELLSKVKPALGVGIDLDPMMIKIAKKNHPNLNFILHDVEAESKGHALLDDKFDYIILSDLFCYLEDCQAALTKLHRWCHINTRVIIAHHAWHWEPVLKLAEKMGVKMPSLALNWLNEQDFNNFIRLSNFEIIKRDQRQLIPIRVFGFEKFSQ